MSYKKVLLALVSIMAIFSSAVFAESLLVEAEGFDSHGGWSLDQQFMQTMGSPYLLAHGMGKPVPDAVTTVDFKSTGKYRMWVRTMDWVPGKWKSPGRFQVILDGVTVEKEFGTLAGWQWQDGGMVDVNKKSVQIKLHDLTGFEGRCDAIFFSNDPAENPLNFDADKPSVNRKWRNKLRGFPDTPPDGGKFDVIIVGGGIAGCGAALAAEERGLRVALVNDREALGGNASNAENNDTSEISGEYYDWTKTTQPETPWNHDYNKTLVTKIFLCSRDGEGNVEKVYLTFEDALEVLKKLDNITLGIPKIAYLVGWQYNGHDSKYPAWGEVNNHLRREEDATALESLKWLIKEARKYNTTVSLHINMIDAFEESPLWEEYLEHDIVAKDTLGNPIKGEVFSGMQSYQISYAREWELGYAKKRIDGLIEMIPELIEGGTIHIDAFHSMRPSGVGEPINLYLGITLDEEIQTQRKIFRYWQSKGIDVTCEGAMYRLRRDPFIGLQAMTWHFREANFINSDWLNKPEDFTGLPVQFTAGTPFNGETEIKKDSENLTGFVVQVCLKLVPWYYRRNADASEESSVIITEDLVICPVLWKEKALIAYSRDRDLKDMKFKLPSTWREVKDVQVSRLTTEGPEPVSMLEVTDRVINFSVKKETAMVLMPKEE